MSADTVGHWRFEKGAFLGDSSGRGFDLTSSGSTSQFDLPSVGVASNFPKRISGLGPNYSAARKGTGAFFQVDNASRAGNAFALDAFTLELMLHAESIHGGSFLAGHGGTSGSWSYALFMAGDGEIRLALNDGLVNLYASNLVIQPGRDYYIGVAVDLTASSPSGRSINFYWQNLSDPNSALEHFSVSEPITTGSLLSSGHPFTIGGGEAGVTSENWSGVIDEVKLSDTVLSRGQLVVIPESAAVGVAAGLLSMLLLLRRRKISASPPGPSHRLLPLRSGH